MRRNDIAEGLSLSDLRYENTLSVFQALRAGGALTRNAACERTGLTQPTVAAILRTLEKQGWVHISNSVTTGGRKAQSYCLNPKTLHVLAVDVQVSSIVGAVVDITGQVHHKMEWPARYGIDGESFTGQLHEIVTELHGHLQTSGQQALAIGLSLPVFLTENGTVLFAPYVGGEGQNVVLPLQQQFGVPVFAENDARAGVRSEVWWTTEANSGTVVYVMADHGVGAGIAIDGVVLAGKQGAAGDIGHAVIDPQGSQCRCGQMGCLETFVSYPAIRQRLVEMGAQLPGSMPEVVYAALRGDKQLQQVLAQSGEYLAVAVSILNMLLAPEHIYLGGALSGAWDIVTGPFERVLHERGPQFLRAGVDIRKATYGSLSGIMGAAALAFDQLLHPANSNYSLLRSGGQPVMPMWPYYSSAGNV